MNVHLTSIDDKSPGIESSSDLMIKYKCSSAISLPLIGQITLSIPLSALLFMCNCFYVMSLPGAVC
jgi:hypothetical protein